MDDFTIFFISVITYILVQTVHEIGHYIPDYIFGLNPYFSYNAFFIPNAVFRDREPNKLRRNIISISGILFGFIPIIIFGLFFIYNFLSFISLVLIILVYIFACENDISKIVFYKKD